MYFRFDVATDEAILRAYIFSNNNNNAYWLIIFCLDNFRFKGYVWPFNVDKYFDEC